jgi:hypothetical protein
MKVVISGDVIEAVCITSDVLKLHELLRHATGRHTIIVNPPEKLNKWLNEIDKPTRDAYAQAVNLCARQASTLPSGISTVFIEQRDSSDWHDLNSLKLTLDDALTVLNEPLGILVENFQNDWYFLFGIMGTRERKRFEEAKKRGWILIEHGGGSTLLAKLNDRLSEPPKKSRTFVMFDSDRLHPNELEENWQPSRRGSCQGFEWSKKCKEEIPLRYWMLKRRFIESYMPKDQLFTVGKDKTEAFLRMPIDAQHYFNMKEGFESDEKHKERHSNLYSGVSQTDRTILKNGFGKDIANKYKDALTTEFNAITLILIKYV